MKQILKLMRVKHYIKNLLIFLPLIFSNNITNIKLLIQTILAFIIFSLITSIVYIFNDLKDVEKDKLHPTKKSRPLASGEITKKQVYIIIIILIGICIISSILIFKGNFKAYLLILTYVALNICYSLKLKNIPIIDITVLAIGYLLRIMYGASIIYVPVSNWLYLTVLSASFYMAMGKRRNELFEITTKKTTRDVLKYYNTNFLDKNMYMCLGLAIVFYSLWCMDICKQINNRINVMYTIPIIIILSMKYSLNIEKDGSGDPVEVILKDKTIIFLLLILAVMLGVNYI